MANKMIILPFVIIYRKLNTIYIQDNEVELLSCSCFGKTKKVKKNI
jgi:hypothetical protein